MNLYVAKWIFRWRPFIEDRMNRCVDRVENDDGFTNLYLHARKPAARPR